jgi:hypothetical protein
LFRNFAGSFEREDDDEQEDEPLVADFGASSVERFAALRLRGESVPPPAQNIATRFFAFVAFRLEFSRVDSPAQSVLTDER